MSASSSAPSRFERTLWQRPWVTGGLLVAAAPLAALYVYLSFTHPNPAARIVLRTLPVLPLAVWTLWFDGERPFQEAGPPARTAARFVCLLGIMTVAIGLLGFGLNWLYDPSRVL